MDGALIPTPATPPPGSEAWLDLSVRLGDLTTELGAQRQARARALRHVTQASAIVPASGIVVLDLGGPAAGREWNVRRLAVYDTVNASGAIEGGAPTAASGTFAAGVAGNVPLPAGATLTGFDVSVLPATAVVSGLISVTNLATVNLNYELTETTTGGGLSVRLPGGIAASSPTATPQVNMPAITGGAAYAITVYGTTAATGATPGAGAWYIGQPSAYGTTSDQWPISSLPYVQRVSSDQITIQPMDHLFAVISDATPGDNLLARASLLDYPTGTGRPVDVI